MQNAEVVEALLANIRRRIHGDLENLNEEVFLYMLKIANPFRSRNITNIPKVQYNAEVPPALSKGLEILPQNQNDGWDLL